MLLDGFTEAVADLSDEGLNFRSNEMRAKSVLIAVVLAVSALLSTPAVQEAQEIPALKPLQRSVVLFDWQLSRWLGEAKSAKLDTSRFEVPFNVGPLKGFRLSQIERIYGSASLPEDIAAFKSLIGGGTKPLPFEIFVQVKFVDAESVKKFEASVRKDSRVVEIGGKEFLQSKGIGPDNFVCRRFDETTFEFGTSVYCQQEKRVFLSDGLRAVYRTAPDHSFRLVIDLETPKTFVEELIRFGRARAGDPVAGAYFDLLEKANSVILTHSLTAENLVTLIVAGDDQADAEEIKDGLESVLGTLKLITRRSDFGLPKGSGPIKVFGEMISSLTAMRDSDLAKVEVARSDRFVESFNEFQTIVLGGMERKQREDRFRQIGLACLNFEAAFQELPFNYDTKVSQEISWRAKVLPFVGKVEIQQRMNLEAGPEDETNSKYKTQMPSVFGAGGELSRISWIKSGVKQSSDITDGTSNTVMLLQTPKGRPWLTANPLSVDEAIDIVVGLPDGEELMIVMYDGSLRTISNSVEKQVLRFLFEPADGNEIPEF